MCLPDYFGIEYEINPWMNIQTGSDSDLARRQWQSLRQTLVELGAAVELIEPVPGLPDLVFTANAAERLIEGRPEVSLQTIGSACARGRALTSRPGHEAAASPSCRCRRA